MNVEQNPYLHNYDIVDIYIYRYNFVSHMDTHAILF